MIDIKNGRYWQIGIELVSGCTPCSPGCDHCWSAAQAQRFGGSKLIDEEGCPHIVENGKFTGEIVTHPDRLKRFNTRKPKVFSIWNDLFHEAVPDNFIHEVYFDMMRFSKNTYLILTKRPQHVVDNYKNVSYLIDPQNHTWHGLTVCNQQEWDEKKDAFLSIPGKKFISHEPALEPILYGDGLTLIDCLISGGETGAGARPSHSDTFRKDRDQCAFYGVKFLFKQWGEFAPARFEKAEGCINHTNGHYWYEFDPDCGNMMKKLGRNKSGRLLDGRTHDDLPWHCAQPPDEA